jgi:serine/threonine-protein kinase
MGTVAYMSPEQARGERVNHPSDIFALGIVLYELATGRHPFKAENLVGYLHAITLQEPPPPTRWKPGLPAGLNDLILRMLSKDARQRPTASEVAQTLQDIERRGDTAKQPADEGKLAPTSGEAQTLLLTPATTALACIYAALGDKDKAFAELEKSYETGTTSCRARKLIR